MPHYRCELQSFLQLSVSWRRLSCVSIGMSSEMHITEYLSIFTVSCVFSSFFPPFCDMLLKAFFPAGLLNFRNCLPLQMTSWDNLCSDCLKAWFLNAICELFEWCQVWIQIGSKYLSVCTVWHHYRFQMRTWYTHVNSHTALLLSSLLRPCMAGLFLPPRKILVLAHFL